MTESNPLQIAEANLAKQKGDLTDKKGIPLSAVVTSANKHDIKAVSDVIDNSVIKRHSLSFFTKNKTRKHILSASMP